MPIVGVALDVAVGSRDAGDATEHAEVGTAGLRDDQQQHRDDTDHQPGKDIEGDHADQGG
ncbi:MAG: hypothetical protein WAL63_08650 [Solirubrobacteraceae bacterium]